jgi:hypothetical protein
MSAQTAAVSKPKFDFKKVGAQFNAWWNGVDLAAVDNEQPEGDVSNPTIVEKSIDEPAQAKASSKNPNDTLLFVSTILWGAGRTTPFCKGFDDNLFEDIEITKNKRLTIFGAEAGERLQKILDGFDCKITNYENNNFLLEKCREYVKTHKKFKNCEFQAFDGKPSSVGKNKSDVLIFLNRGTSLNCLEANIFAAARNLKPSGIGYWVDFFAPPEYEIGDKYSAPEGREFINYGSLKQTMEAAGLEVFDDEDVGAHFLNSFMANQKNLKENWENVQAHTLQNGGIDAANVTLKQLIGWRNRVEALKTGRLSLRKISFCKG